MGDNNIPKKSSDTGLHIGKVIIIALIIMGSILIIKDAFGGGNSTSRTCQSCHKTFTNSADMHSIAYTNMCESCHDNYEFARDLKEDLTKELERSR